MSNQAKHTPGPWKYNRQTGYIFSASDSGSRVELQEHGGAMICSMIRPDENAALVAAAPEMCEALRVTMDHSYSDREAYDLVRAAIAKAEGRAS